MKKIIALFLALIMVLGLVACGAKEAPKTEEKKEETSAPATEEKKEETKTEEKAEEKTEEKTEEAAKKIGVSLYYLKDEWYVGVSDEFKKQGAERGYEVFVTDADADFTKQLEHIENLQSQGVDLMCIAPVDDNGIVSTIDDLVAAGTPVLAYGTCPAGGDFFSYVGWDVYQTGYDLGLEAGKYINESLGGKANVAMLVVLSLENLKMRSDGFKAGLDASGCEYTIVAEQDYDGDRDKAMTAMESILQMGETVDVVFSAQDPGAFGARAALEATDVDARIYSCGGFGDEIYEALSTDDKYIAADIIVSPYLFVKGIYDCIDEYYAGNAVEKEYLVDILVCTHENYKEVYGE